MDLSSVEMDRIKANIKELNGTKGLLETPLKLSGNKQVLVKAFVGAIEKLDDDGKTNDIPDGPFNFYNELSDLEEEPADEGESESAESQSSQKKPPAKKTTPPAKKKPAAKKAAPKKKPAAKKPAAKKPAAKKTPAKKTTPAKKKPAAAAKPPAKKPATGEKKMTTAGQARKIYATNKMSLKFDGDKFMIGFATGKKKTFKLNFKKAEKDKLRRVVNNSLKFAVENGATDGQQKALRKSFSQAGWYLTR